MNIIQDLIPLNTPHNRRPGIKRRVEYICIHNTSNPTSSARQERNWLTNLSNDRTASFNYVIDDNNVICCIPDLEVTYNAGDGQGKGNINSLSIEICESGNYAQAEANAIKFIVEKMLDYNLTIDKIKPHKFFSGKNCPHIILPYWDDFIARIQAEYNTKTTPEVIKVEEVKPCIIDLVARPILEKEWEIVAYDSLINRGIQIDERRFNEPITRGESMALMDKVLKSLGK